MLIPIDTFTRVQTPMKRVVKYRPFIGRERSYYLSFPYIVFRLEPGGRFRVAFAHQMPGRVDSPLCWPLVGNIYPNLTVCQPYSETIKEAIDIFWQTAFYEEPRLYNTPSNEIRRMLIGSYSRWQRLSRRDNLFDKIKMPVVQSMGNFIIENSFELPKFTKYQVIKSKLRSIATLGR